MADTLASGAPAPSSLDYRFAGYGYQNWCHGVAPPVTVNPAAPLHAKLAWCWGEMHQIDELASVLCTSQHNELASVGNLLANKAIALIAMLEHMAAITKAEG